MADEAEADEALLGLVTDCVEPAPLDVC